MIEGAGNYTPSRFMLPSSIYDCRKADRAVRFIESLTHTIGQWRGQPFVLLPWQERIVRDVFGIVDAKTGFRQFKRVYIEIPKKQGKTELDAAVALKLLCADDEPSAEIYGCASDRQQAGICFKVAADMVRLNPVLRKKIKIIESLKRMIYLPNGSFYQVLSAEAYSKHGFNVHGLIFDELHAMPDRKLFDVMTQGSGDARRQPLFFFTTTAGTDVHSICHEQHQKAVDILEGRKIDPTFYPVIFAAGQDDDWTSEETWRKCNPSLGVTISLDSVREWCNSAKQNPAEENNFRQLRLCQWVKQAVRWMPMAAWDACEHKIDADALKGRVCYGGLDLSSTIDLTSFVLCFPPIDDGEPYILLAWYWLPEETLDVRVRRDHVPYDVWRAQGRFFTTEGNVVHYKAIERFIEQLSEIYNIREIAYDRWGATQVAQDLEEMGLTVIPFGQGFRDMSPPTKELLKLVLEKKIAHDGNPVLHWNFDNALIRKDPAGNIKLDKEKSTEKIDGAVASVMALDRALRGGVTETESVYERRGLIVV